MKRNYLDEVIDMCGTGCSAAESQLQREKERKRRVHEDCVYLITGRKPKTKEQVKKELNQNDW